MSYVENDKNINKIVSAWTGHKQFAKWLVKETKPDTVVELGVDYGFSTFTFANEMKNEGKGIMYGIDWFKGDTQTGMRNTKTFVDLCVDSMQLHDHIKIIESSFDDALKNWHTPIDILHIDGFHQYESVKNDFESWKLHVKDEGVIIMHDVCCFHGDFGVYKLYNEIGNEYCKGYFEHSYGLGVITKNKDMFERIYTTHTNFNILPFIAN